MKKLKYVFAIAGFLTFTACHNSKEVAEDAVTEVKESAPIYKNVTANEFKSLLSNNPGTLVDVRTPREFKGGYIPGAINIDYFSSDFKQKMSELDKTKPVYVYCRSGNKSGKSMLILQELGFKEVYNLIGGYSRWPKTSANPNQVPVHKATK